MNDLINHNQLAFPLEEGSGLRARSKVDGGDSTSLDLHPHRLHSLLAHSGTSPLKGEGHEGVTHDK